MKILEKASAKINLSLDVLYKRDDGYHEVEMIMTMVDLADRIEIQERLQDKITLSSQSGYIPLDEKNLAFQAAKLIKSRYRINQGVHIHIDKHIPIAAGLAGGSSDAAATLRGLNRLWGLDIPMEELQSLGAMLGSDVPFCIGGGTALATGRGELLQAIDSPPPCWVILAKPPINVSTSDIYTRLKADLIKSHPPTAALLSAIQFKDLDKLCAGMGNVLEEVTLNMYPAVLQLKRCMENLGAEGVLMSGSGPTVFGIASKEVKARRIFNGLRGFCNEVYVVRLLT